MAAERTPEVHLLLPSGGMAWIRMTENYQPRIDVALGGDGRWIGPYTLKRGQITPVERESPHHIGALHETMARHPELFAEAMAFCRITAVFWVASQPRGWWRPLLSALWAILRAQGERA